MIRLVQIEDKDVEAISTLAANCFLDDPFYVQLSHDVNERFSLIKDIFRKSTRICIKYGLAYGHKEEDKFISFILLFNYEELKKYDIQGFNYIFRNSIINEEVRQSLANEITEIENIINKSDEFFYLLAIGVDNQYRRNGYASLLVKTCMDTYPNYNMFGDVSNSSSINLYTNLGFNVIKKESDLTFVVYYAEQDNIILNNEEIWLAVPKTFDENIIGLNISNEFDHKIKNIKVVDEKTPFFVPSLDNDSLVRIIQISYYDLIKYQRYINVLFFIERKIYIKDKFVLLYTSDEFNFNGLNFLKEKDCSYDKKEWDIIPDLFTSIPVRYNDKNKLVTKNKRSFLVNRLLKSLDFRTTFESGIPIQLLDSKKFKYRIERYYLGTVKLQILEENLVSFNGLKQNETPLGCPTSVELIISIDNQTNSAVLHLMSLSFGLLMTHYLDSVSRNQVNVLVDNKNINLYHYLETNFGIEKKVVLKISLPFRKKERHWKMIYYLPCCFAKHYMMKVYI